MKRVVLVTTRSLLGSTKSIPVTPVATVVISQHAPISQVDAGAEAATGAKADGIVSFGGGSVIDAAKIISVRSAGGEGRALPHIAVPTTLSVAELAAGAGFTDEGGDKAGMRDPRLLVETVVYDAELTLATPLGPWPSTGIPALDAADRVQQLIESLGLPQHIAECGIGEAQLRIAAEQLGGKHRAVDLLEIYKSAL